MSARLRTPTSCGVYTALGPAMESLTGGGCFCERVVEVWLALEQPLASTARPGTVSCLLGSACAACAGRQPRAGRALRVGISISASVACLRPSMQEEEEAVEVGYNAAGGGRGLEIGRELPGARVRLVPGRPFYRLGSNT